MPPERAALPRAVAAHLHLANRAASATSLALDRAARGMPRSSIRRPASGSRGARSSSMRRSAPSIARSATSRPRSPTSSRGSPRPPGSARRRSHGPVGDALARRLRHGRLDALEAGFTRWAQRRHDGAVRAPIDEWREWCALRSRVRAAAAAAGGLELRRLAFPHAYSTGSSHGGVAVEHAQRVRAVARDLAVAARRGARGRRLPRRSSCARATASSRCRRAPAPSGASRLRHQWCQSQPSSSWVT